MAPVTSEPATDASLSPERDLALDMLKRGIPVAPILIGLAAAVWGVHGAMSAGFGIAVVLINLSLAAASMAWAGRYGATAIMAAALGGFAVRMLLVVLALVAVRGQSWVVEIPLGLTIVLTHLGLLVWETRYVSATLAYPALKPRRSEA